MKKIYTLMRLAVVLTVGFLLLTLPITGQSIWTNPITDPDPTTSNPFVLGQTVNANITVSGVGRSPGINPTSAINRYNARDWNFPAMDLNDYFYFTLTPNACFKINFVSFVYTGQSSGTGPPNIAVRSSVDGYTTNIGAAIPTGATINLSVAAYQNINSAITFRVYGWGGTNVAGTFSINDFTFNGTVVPSTTITTGVVTGTPFFVPGCATTGTVAFTSTCTFTAGNIYTAQLSDASGVFGSPVNIGTLSSTANSGIINFTIPGATVSGTNYKIRVVSSTPTTNGSSSAAFTINNGIAGTAGLWVGSQNTDWSDCRNWANYAVPTSATNVTLNQTSSNNCIIGGSSAAVCNNLSISSSTNALSLTVQNAASLTCGGDVTITKTGSNNNVKLTLLNSASFTCNNLSMAGTASGAENAQFENETSASVTAIINGNLTIHSGGKLDLSNPPNSGIIHVKGSYSNNGLETDFKQTNSVVHFDGTINQSINTPGFAEIFSNIVINKPSGVMSLFAPIDIENNLTYTSGIIYSSLSYMINFYDDATATGMNNNSFSLGPVRKTGNDAFIFPIGDGIFYRPASISAPSNITDQFTGEYANYNPNSSYNVLLKDPTLDHISNCEYWIIDRTTGSSAVNVTLTWNPVTSCGVTDLADLRVARWDLSMWRDHGNGGTTGNTTAGSIVTSAAVTSFSPFTLSSASSENPLPVELISFDANCEDGKIKFNWTTVSEINNSYFEIQGSQDAYTYQTMETIDGNGTSNQMINYSSTLTNYDERNKYFRLSQVDYNGSTTYFSPVALTCEFQNNGLKSYYTGSQVQLILPSDLSNELLCRITDMSGKTLLITPLNNSGTIVTVRLPDHLSAGIYTISLFDQIYGKEYHSKMFKDD